MDVKGLSGSMQNESDWECMICAACNNAISGKNISAVGKFFCCKICHLKFWKNEMPNLGGRWITDEDISKIENADEQTADNEYARIVTFIMNNLSSSSVMLNLRYGLPPEDKRG